MKLLQANAFQIPLPDKSVHMCVTSPPYYSLRKYAGEQEFIFGGDKDCVHGWENPIAGKSQSGSLEGSTLEGSHVGEERRPSWESSYCRKCNAWRGAYGLEPTLQMYIDHTVEWCREVWRVLRDDATFWLNLGDSYAGSGGAGGDYNEGGLKEGQPKYPGTGKTMKPSYRRDKEPVPRQQGRAAGLKAKDLMMVPARVAIALQEDGWYLRSDIIWHKPNPMPESITDRPTKSHEYLFLLSKRPRYYYDADAIREKGITPENSKAGHAFGGKKLDAEYLSKSNIPGKKWDWTPGRNRRTVWTIATAPYSGAHFATFPPALIEPCIKAGTSEKGVCPECGNPWERVTKKAEASHKGKTDGQYQENSNANRIALFRQTARDQGSEYSNTTHTIGWRPTCSDYDDLYRTEFPQARNARKRHQQDVGGYWWKRVRQRPGKDHWQVLRATVLDPFSGSGVTLLVARKLGRRAIGLDISAEYLDLAKERLGLKALEEWESGKPGETDIDDLPLFSDTLQ